MLKHVKTQWHFTWWFSTDFPPLQASTSASSNMAVNSVSCSHRVNLGVTSRDGHRLFSKKSGTFIWENFDISNCSMSLTFINIHQYSPIFNLQMLGFPNWITGSFQAILWGGFFTEMFRSRCSKGTFLWRCTPGGQWRQRPNEWTN